VRSAAWYYEGRDAPSKHYERRLKCHEVTDKARHKAAEAEAAKAPDEAAGKVVGGDAWAVP